MKTSQRNESGSTIAVAVMVLATLVVCVGAALDYSQQVARVTQRTLLLQTATEIADGCLNMEFASWREICREQPNSVLSGTWFSGIPTPSGTNFFLSGGTNYSMIKSFTVSTGTIATSGTTPYTIYNYRIQAVDPQLNPIQNGTGLPSPAYGMTAANSASNSLSFYYLASANVSIPTVQGPPVTLNLRRIFQKQIESFWAFAVYYNDDLEMHPGATMNISGWVHTNGNLYTGAGNDTSNLLTLGNLTNYSKSWYPTGDAPGDVDNPSNAVLPPNYPSNLPPAQGNPQQLFGMDPGRIFNNSTGNPNDQNYHEIIEPPVSGFADPLAPVRMEDLADVIVSVNNTGSVSIYSGNGAGSKTLVTSGALYNDVSAAISVSNGANAITDARQGTVSLVNVDVSRIYSATQLSGTNKLVLPHGIIYVYNTGPDLVSPAPQWGVRLKNGATLPTGGLTVASENPVYIQGDYNTGANGGTFPLSDAAVPDTTQPTVSTYTRQPAAIMADSINILSNNWVDSNSSLGLGSRVATNTTVNAAFMGGIVPTSVANGYGGGVENFPRFLENWGGKTFTYYGSIVELYASQQGTGLWSNASYSPPNRAWYFDTNFQINPPPGPVLMNYINGIWYTE